MKTRLAIAALGLGLASSLLFLGACSSEAYKNSLMIRAKALRAAPEYSIGPGDNITIRVLGHEEYQIETRVRPDGKVSFPEHGDIQVAGKPVEQVRQELQEEFKTSLGLRSPKLYVSAEGFNSQFVTILGEVLRPGRYPYTGQTRVVDILGEAIDWQQVRSAPNKALLFREIEGATKVYQVHLKDFWYKADFTTNFYVRPGDVLYVPKNGFAEIADEVEKVLLPVRALVNGIGLGNTTARIFVP